MKTKSHIKDAEDVGKITAKGLREIEPIVAKEMVDVWFLLRCSRLTGGTNVFIDFKSRSMARRAKLTLEDYGYEVWDSLVAGKMMLEVIW